MEGDSERQGVQKDGQIVRCVLRSPREYVHERTLDVQKTRVAPNHSHRNGLASTVSKDGPCEPVLSSVSRSHHVRGRSVRHVMQSLVSQRVFVETHSLVDASLPRGPRGDALCVSGV